MKIKAVWVFLLSAFVSLFYVMYKVNTFTLSKPLILIEIGNKNESAIKVDIQRIGKNTAINQTTSVKTMNKKTLSDGLNGQTPNGSTYHEDIVLKSSNIEEQIEFSPNETKNSCPENVTICGNNTNNKTRIGILIPSSARRLKSPTLENLTLINTCIPSIYKTIENVYEYVIYIGIDKGDYLETVLERLEKFDNVKIVVSPGRTFTKCVNALARKAYQDGMDYFVRINDDSSFETNNWTSEGIKVLNKYSPMNVGVVGPTCHQGNTGILTHDMVHRTHLEIFEFYYPPYFDNWWADDWITKVYSPNRSTKLSTWVVKHHIGAHGTRYNVDHKKEERLAKLLVFDTERLNEYVSNI